MVFFQKNSIRFLQYCQSVLGSLPVVLLLFLFLSEQITNSKLKMKRKRKGTFFPPLDERVNCNNECLEDLSIRFRYSYCL